MSESETTSASEAAAAGDPEISELRMVEAILFAAEAPLSIEEIAARMPQDADVSAQLEALQSTYADRGINLVRLGGRYMFRTAPDLAFLLRREVDRIQRLSRAGVETLAIIAYHQPVTRAEIEEIRGVGLSRGTLDTLLEAGWIRPRGRKQTPGRPVMYATTEAFLAHFGLESLDDLPGLGELKAAGLLDSVDEALAQMEELAADDSASAPESDAGEEGAGQTALDLDSPVGAGALRADRSTGVDTDPAAPDEESPDGNASSGPA